MLQKAQPLHKDDTPHPSPFAFQLIQTIVCLSNETKYVCLLRQTLGRQNMAKY